VELDQIIFPTGSQPLQYSLTAQLKPNCSSTIQMLPYLNIWFKFYLMVLVVFFCSRGKIFSFFFFVLSILFSESYFSLMRFSIDIFW